MIAIVKFKNKIKKFQISPDIGAGSRVGNVNLVVSDLVQETEVQFLVRNWHPMRGSQ